MEEQISQFIEDLNTKIDNNKEPNKIEQLKTEITKDSSGENDKSKKRIVLIDKATKEEKKIVKNITNKIKTSLKKEKIFLTKKRKIDSSLEKESTLENENNKNIFLKNKEEISSFKGKIKEKGIINNNVDNIGLKYTNNFKLFTFSGPPCPFKMVNYYINKEHLFEPKLYDQKFEYNSFKLSFYENERIIEERLNNLYYIK